MFWLFCTNKCAEDGSEGAENILSKNSLATPPPHRILLEHIHSSSVLDSGQELRLPVLLHAPYTGEHDLCLLLVYREVSRLRRLVMAVHNFFRLKVGDDAFHSTRLTRQLDVHPVIDVATSSKAGSSLDSPYSVDLEINNVASYNIKLTQVTALSHTWTCFPMSDYSE